MKVTTFTDTMVRRLKPQEKKIIRGEGNGFSVRVMPSGVKTWLYVYSFEGKRRELNLGNYPDVSLETARTKFEDAKRKVKNGLDPLEEKERQKEERRKAPTVSDLITEYIERHAKRFKKSWKKDEQILNRELIPAWGKRKAADITKGDVIRLLESIINRGAPAMANNTFQIIRKMFNWAIEKDILLHSPCAGLKLPSPKISRDRTLTALEIKALWQNLDLSPMTEEIRRAVKLILVTAQRPGEVIGIHSSEIDGRWWTIPAERAKNKKGHRVYLTDLALELIGNTAGKGYIFKTPQKHREQPMGGNALNVAINRSLASPVVDAQGNLILGEDGKPETKNLLGIDKFTPHDLRRTAATFMAEMGTMDEVIDAILNHSKQGVIKVYNTYRYDREKQMALEAWTRKISEITTSAAGGQVIPLHKKVSTP